MGTSAKQDGDFIRSVIGNNLLEQSLEWIADNLEPEDVFSDVKMREWGEEFAENNGYVKEDES